MNDGGAKMMNVRRETAATMHTQQGSIELPELYSSPATAFYTPSRASVVIPVYSNEQLTTTVPARRHYEGSPDESHSTGTIHQYIASPPPALGKLRHHHIPLPSQTGIDIRIVLHPLLRPTCHEEMLMELDFAAQSLSGVRVLGHEGCVNGAATSPPLPSLAIVHPKLPWPVVIQRSGDREWVTVADVVETLWHAMHIRDPITPPSPSSLSLLKNQNNERLTGSGMSGCTEREVVLLPRLAYLKGKTRFMGLHAIEGDTWELLVA
ncbi:uncharacterized protein EV420DRAFT_737583 [Desarmillaria tabescens]|uniref:DUF6699 domain-containing protein n=1 Tax=Armillaria tabescens TaxID=1929756 RepID=A0AA39JXB0_ARMTA|nr:uncharacterized protein EV420DRAFT_737583 [Desarmillaria tabescens]KAK0450509.1 hypothetical protein EV420DRAFT_737583 [Desarmillaria tabescens]